MIGLGITTYDDDGNWHTFYWRVTEDAAAFLKSRLGKPSAEQFGTAEMYEQVRNLPKQPITLIEGLE